MHKLICKLIKSNEEIRRYSRRDRQMKSRFWSYTPIDVNTNPFLFTKIGDQLDRIKQANSNYEENKSSCSWSYSSTQSFKEKCEETSDSKLKSRHAEI